MRENLFLPEARSWRAIVKKFWKWVAVAIFVVVQLFDAWLPLPAVLIGSVLGMAAIVVLGVQGLRYLKNRLLWSVRNRILGSFIFVGVIPLLLILGTLFLLAYMLAGQLAARYVEDSIGKLAREMSWIGSQLRDRVLQPGDDRFQDRAAAVFAAHSAGFPKMAAHRLGRADGSFVVEEEFDPQLVAAGIEAFQVERWMAGAPAFEGLIREGDLSLLAAVMPLEDDDSYLVVSAPLDAHLEGRLQNEHGIYTTLLSSSDTNVQVDGSSVQVTIRNEEGETRDAELEGRIQAKGRQADDDGRFLISWMAFLVAGESTSFKEDYAALAVVHVPVELLYTNYVAKYSELVPALLIVVGVLFGLFLLAELVSLIIGLVISRRVTRSVHEMYKGTQALQAGDLQHRIPVRREDQLGQLARSFNDMSSAITRLMAEVTEKERLEKELEIAREVQTTLFPKQLPRPRGLSVFGGCEPAQVVSGDYYDFIVEDETHLHIVLGDISGKGISAALLMANLQAAMRSQLVSVKSSGGDMEVHLSEIMARLNRQIYRSSPSEKYATLFFGTYDAESRRLYYCNAGHLPPVLLQDGNSARLEVGGTVLGLFEKAEFQSHTISLERGSLFAVFTDGVTEAVNDREEDFGEDRLIEILRGSRSEPPDVVYHRVIAGVKDWQGKLKQHDDITLIVGRVE